ncbi:hypothetical protein DFH07DRAFT_765052 [Mycena maculata]|uniref:Uncharacterized protein n=1 Tax=Mycena maculata TaxID=230809 RepID=A0AAD7KAG5_9AGAR|nr:hypothetical protein DFH07DRAFT_765052 [Mycena maculata]
MSRHSRTERSAKSNKLYPTSAVNQTLGEMGLPQIAYAEIHQLLDGQGIHRDDPRRPEMIQEFMARVDQIGIVTIGKKPEAAYQEVFMVKIPEDDLQIRLFTGETRREQGIFFFDFFSSRGKVPVNAPQGYFVEIVSPGGLAGRIPSVEATFGVNNPDPGMEKFTVVENALCRLTRPYKGPFLFKVPERNTPPAIVAQAVRVQ